MAMIRKLAGLAALLVSLAACGGGGGSSSSTSTATSTPAPVVTAPALTNLATITVDGGPPVLQTGSHPVIEANIAYVSVTLCAPGTKTCQTIDHVQVDTGSVGLRIASSVLTPPLLAALPTETDDNANPVGECYSYVDGYAFGSVRQADFQIGGEAVSDMPLQVIGDGGVFSTVPSSCSAAGGTNLTSVQSLGANGIIGIGTETTDCGSVCATTGGLAAASYYDCPSSGCSASITRAVSTTAPFQQVPNPVAAMSVDNNGTIISLPSATATGQATLTGTLYFGIGTETNNGLGSATVLTTTVASNTDVGGFVTINYNGQTLPDSFLDSGTSLYLFSDSTIPQCTGKNYTGFYCPASPQTLSPTVVGTNGVSASAAFTLNNGQALLATVDAALPGLGGDPNGLNFTNDYPTSFSLGLPFFFGRSVYTAIEGRNAGGAVGPYYAY